MTDDPADYTHIPGQPPSLQDLSIWWGGYHQIPDWAWREFNRAAVNWRGLCARGALWYPPFRDTLREASERRAKHEAEKAELLKLQKEWDTHPGWLKRITPRPTTAPKT